MIWLTFFSSSGSQVSPIGYCHVLLTPKIQDCLQQRIDQESFLIAMYVAREARNPFFRVGYNSLAALQLSITFTSRLVFTMSIRHILLGCSVTIDKCSYITILSASHILAFCSLGILPESTVSSWKGNHGEAHEPREWREHFSPGGLSSQWLFVRRWCKPGRFVGCGIQSVHLFAREQQTFQCPQLWIWQESFPPTTGIAMQP